MKKYLYAFVIVISIFLSSEDISANKDEFLIGLEPEENIFRLMERHRPLETYLSEKLGIKVRFTILPKYGDIIDRFTSRNMAGAFFDAFSGVLAHEKLKVQPLVRSMHIDGSLTVQGYIFVRKDSNITSVKEMKGKRAVFVDRAAATGYIFPLAFFRKNTIVNMDRFFREYFFAGSHDSAVYAVLDRRADVGAVKSRIFNKLSAKDPLIGEEILIIAKSLDMPDITLFLRKDIDLAIGQKIKDILLNMHNDQNGREVLKKLETIKFVSASMADFKPIRELIEKAGIDLKSYKYK